MSQNDSSIISFHATTILAVRHKGKVAIGGDGQVSYTEQRKATMKLWDKP